MNKLVMSLMAGAALALTVPAIAQQKAPDTKAAEKKAEVVIPKNTFYRGQGPTQYLAKDRLIGVKVYNTKGELIGDIEDLVLGAADNDVQGVIMGVGGFLGVAEKKIGVRYSALKSDTKDGKKIVILDVSKEVLAAVDAYGRTEPKKTLLEKAKEAAKSAAERSKEVGKAAAEKAKEVGKAAAEKAKEAAKPKTP
jgi:sporulation protein YlmC with PRC-barrel domain